MADEVNAQQDNKKQKPTFPNMIFPSAGEVDSEYFGGTAPEKISLDDIKQNKEEQKNEKTKFINAKKHIRRALAKAYSSKKYVKVGGKK